MSNKWFKTVSINILIIFILAEETLFTQVLLLHLLIAFDDTCTVVQGLVKPRYIHKLCIVVHKNFGLVYFHEALSKSMHDLTCARVIAESEQAVGLVQGCLVAVPHLEPLLIPAYHGQSLLQLLHVSRDVRYLNLGPTHYQTTREVDSFHWISLLYQLVVSVECLSEGVIDAPWGQRLLLRLQHAVKWGQ